MKNKEFFVCNNERIEIINRTKIACSFYDDATYKYNNIEIELIDLPKSNDFLEFTIENYNGKYDVQINAKKIKTVKNNMFITPYYFEIFTR